VHHPSGRAVRRKREDPTGGLDVVRLEPAGIAIDRDERGLDLRRLEIAEHFAQQGAAEGGRLVELAWLRRHRPLWQREQRCAIEGEGVLEADILQGAPTCAV